MDEINAAGLASGKHKIRVVSHDKAGNTRTRRANFQRCKRAGINFTG